MTVRKVVRSGQPRLVIDIHYRKRDGSKGRYRSDAQVQTMAAARAEERRLLGLIAQHGEPFEPRDDVSSGEPKSITFKEAVELFRNGKAVNRLKPSSRVGYEEIFETRLLTRFGEVPLDAIGYEDVEKLDAEMVREKLSASRRRNVIICVRSVLRAACEAGRLTAMPRLPQLPKKGRKAIVALTLNQVTAILDASPAAWEVAFGLAAYAGLRAGEVRALRWRDVDLTSGVLIVRHAKSKGEVSTPKSGHEREVPLAKALVVILGDRKKPGELVAKTSHGSEWGESGLIQAFRRATKRAGLSGFRFHDLRHFFVTQLFRQGGSAPAVQCLAGHLHLATTQRYAHLVRADLKATIGLLDEPR